MQTAFMNLALDMKAKMNIDEVITWVNTAEGKQGKELALLLKEYYKSRKDRFLPIHLIKEVFNEFLTYGSDSFRAMECEVSTHLNLK
jgi:hypothetical protein